jgi:hypothetical protein
VYGAPGAPLRLLLGGADVSQLNCCIRALAPQAAAAASPALSAGEVCREPWRWAGSHVWLQHDDEFFDAADDIAPEAGQGQLRMLPGLTSLTSGQPLFEPVTHARALLLRSVGLC